MDEKLSKVKQWLIDKGWYASRCVPDRLAAHTKRFLPGKVCEYDPEDRSFAELLYDLLDNVPFPPNPEE